MRLACCTTIGCWLYWGYTICTDPKLPPGGKQHNKLHQSIPTHNTPSTSSLSPSSPLPPLSLPPLPLSIHPTPPAEYKIHPPTRPPSPYPQHAQPPFPQDPRFEQIQSMHSTPRSQISERESSVRFAMCLDGLTLGFRVHTTYSGLLFYIRDINRMCLTARSKRGAQSEGLSAAQGRENVWCAGVRAGSNDGS